MLLTAEKIAKQAEALEGLANIRAINKMYRDQAESLMSQNEQSAKPGG